MIYPAHPLADIFPMIADPDLKVLAADIAANGQVEPILLLEGQVLDGRNRQAACLLAGVEPIYSDFTGADPLSYVLSKNLHRRHLNESQRAMAAALIVDWERGVNQTTAGAANLQTRRAAEKLSVSERSVFSAKRIREHGAPELIEAIRAGSVKVHTGAALSELQHTEQARVVREGKKAILAMAKGIRAEQQEVKRAVRTARMIHIAERGKATAPAELGQRYSIYYADPPWKYEVWSEESGMDRSAENHYPTMETDAIIALFHQLGIADPEFPGIMFLWCTNAGLRSQGIRVLEECGFEYVHHWIWDKVHQGNGHWGFDCHELLLIGRRGDVVPPPRGMQPQTVYREPKGRHSAKPAFFAETIERLWPDLSKLELFCRSPRPGWDAWGYEAAGGDK
ncbi:Spo0J and IME4 domain-containing protein [Ochrobactrum soli]|uniref:Adenine-specific DNA methyltransferase n=1 Tax=Ochrobactrum soli TaxID=2448455 RepID=A0A2P9HHU9_9HYPH|nr:MT-A70 family methyltransferase [[Ochrobactrum] soli]SPL63603.1 Adenine-specific DNA methyltransferase [[Ochrobactrum] soli]